MIRLLSYNRNPNIGVVARANDSFALVPKDASSEFCSVIGKTLKVEVLKTNISGTTLVGTMIAMNNKGVVLPKNSYSQEIEIIKETGLNFAVIDDKFTALGNLILLNDYGAIVAKGFSEESIRIMRDIFECEVKVSKISGFRNIGSVGIATNRGAILHPELSEDELKWIEGILDVPVDIGTVNRGVNYVRTGIVANTKGVVVGELTTGVEIVRIENTLIGR